MTLGTCWARAKAWYHDRLDPDYRRKKPDEMRELFDSLGLTGEFWAVG